VKAEGGVLIGSRESSHRKASGVAGAMFSGLPVALWSSWQLETLITLKKNKVRFYLIHNYCYGQACMHKCNVIHLCALLAPTHVAQASCLLQSYRGLRFMNTALRIFSHGGQWLAFVCAVINLRVW
jgi:hypothetical protein